MAMDSFRNPKYEPFKIILVGIQRELNCVLSKYSHMVIFIRKLWSKNIILLRVVKNASYILYTYISKTKSLNSLSLCPTRFANVELAIKTD